MAARSNRAYIFSSTLAFMPHPYISGWWVRSHPCVLLIPCPNCKAEAGKLCQRKGEVVLYVCWTRRKGLSKSAALKIQPAGVPIPKLPETKPEVVPTSEK